MADLETIDFSAYPSIAYWKDVRGPLFEILATLTNRVDRDLRADLETRAQGFTTWLVTHIRGAQQIWEVIEELAARVKQRSMKLEAAVTIPPLARGIVESVFSIAFVAENPVERLPAFWKSTWREIAEQYQNLAADYGSDPAWTEWLGNLAAQRDSWRDLLASMGSPLTEAELADIKRVKFWPNPGSMSRQCTDPTRQQALLYFNVRFYGELSGASHLSGRGMLAQGGILLDTDEELNRKYFSDQVMIALTALFSLVTLLTIEVERTPALARRVQRLWQTSNLWTVALETYERCFKARLEALAR
jgi:hypothetical protein